METGIDLIFCAGQNTAFTDVAESCVYLIGTRSDHWLNKKFKSKCEFLDVDYKSPDFSAHAYLVGKYNPKYALVPDLLDTCFYFEDARRVNHQAKMLSRYADNIILVPKLREQVDFLDDGYVIGYSIPTSNGGAKYSFQCLKGRRVHLLGGSPHAQMRCYLWSKSAGIEVVSADGSMAKERAISHCKYWRYSGKEGGQWTELPQDGKPVAERRLVAWQRSCENIYQAWQVLQARKAA